MNLHERVLRITLGRHRASALLGDLEEDAARSGASRGWVRRQALRCALTAARLAAWRSTVRLLMTARLALRDARRSIWHFRATSALAILVLGFSIAAGAVTYAVVDAVLLRPLPYAEGHRLAAIFATTTRGPQLIVSPADYYAWRERSTSFEALAAYQLWPGFELRDDPNGPPISMVMATASLFDVLRARPLLGTAFTDAHEVKGSENVAVISHSLWQRRFGGDPAVIGRTLPVPAGDVRIIGVMPPDFAFPVEAVAPAAVWRPVVVPPDQRVLAEASGRASYLQVVGRLRDGVEVEQARADVLHISDSLKTAFPQLYMDWRPRTELVSDAMTERVAGWMRLVLAAVVVLVAIACANVANLLLTRSTCRSRDIAVRASLGASRLQLLAGLLAESFLLATAAVASGLVLAFWLLGLVKGQLPAGLPRAHLIGLDSRVLLASALACVATAIVAGLVPGWQASRVSLAEVTKATSHGTATRHRRLWQNTFLVAQVALVTVLLGATTLLVGSFVRVLQVDLGFEHRNLLAVRLSPVSPADPLQRKTWLREFNLRALETARAVPGVQSVAALTGGALPLYRGSSTARISAAGSNAAPIAADMRRVTSNYFETAGIPLLRGRPFTPAERHQKVLVIDSRAAQHFFGADDPVGRTIALPGVGDHNILGVAANVRVLGPEGATQPQIYKPIEDDAALIQLVIRTGHRVQDVAPRVHASIAALMPRKSPRVTVNVVEEQYRILTADRRFNAAMMTALGLVALVIGVAGIYASTSTMVAQRTKEIGIRMALGASLGRVVGTVTEAAARLLLAGLVIGSLGSWATAGFLKSLVFGIEPSDVLVYAVPFAIVIAAGTLAALVPARRAARVDPLIALRAE